MGRHSLYTPELGQAIADKIAENYTLAAISDMEGMPDKATILRWGARFDDFAAKCARARLTQADLIVDDMADIIEKVSKGTLSPEQGRVILSGKQWIAAKKNPKSYGDKMTLAGDADNPLFALGKRLDAIQDQQAAMIDVTPEPQALPAPGSDLC